MKYIGDGNPVRTKWMVIGLVCFLLISLQACGTSKKKIQYHQSPRTVGQKIAVTAGKYIGTPYRYGGTSPKGFDCSGLTYYVYKKFGYKLPRRARDQMKKGKHVAKSKLKPGDLVFFKSSYYSGYHVGIFVGNGKFIHAPSSGKRVETQSLTKGYYRRKYYTARRIVGAG